MIDPRGLILGDTNNYGIVKTETVFGFGPSNRYLNLNENTTEQIKWILPHLSPVKTDRSLKSTLEETKQNDIPMGKGHAKKCVFKLIKDGAKGGMGPGRRRRRKSKLGKMMKKNLMMPIILGLLAAKSVLIPIALKALAFMSAKGLMMGFFSTVMASVLSLKGMFEQHKTSDRRDSEKTQVEIIQIPTPVKTEDHTYYEEPYRRMDYVNGYRPYR